MDELCNREIFRKKYLEWVSNGSHTNPWHSKRNKVLNDTPWFDDEDPGFDQNTEYNKVCVNKKLK
jgi:hypothetical protein